MAYFPLNIGSFCSVIQNVVPHGSWSLYGWGRRRRAHYLKRIRTMFDMKRYRAKKNDLRQSTIA